MLMVQKQNLQIQLRDDYLNLMQKCLLNTIYEDPSFDPWTGKTFNSYYRERGLDWPSQAHTMIGEMRMSNIRKVAEFVLENNIPGDFIETGVWRGGCCIYMRAILKAFGDTERAVWVADSFEGLPKPNETMYPADTGDKHFTHEQLAVSLEEVKSNFEKYGLLDQQVKFLKGWFKDTLPSAPIDQLAILRLDGDMYESTMDSLTALYDKVVPGGFVIVDDYGAIPACKQAITDFREQRNIQDEIYNIDNLGVFWQKTC